MAGALKRSDKGRPEDQVLMRALRDFNVPKIVTDDSPVFLGLIGDLFPAVDVPRKRDFDFESAIRQAVLVSMTTATIFFIVYFKYMHMIYSHTKSLQISVGKLN